MSRNQLAEAHCDAVNAVLAAVGYNFARVLAWLRFLLSLILNPLHAIVSYQPIDQAARAHSSRTTLSCSCRRPGLGRLTRHKQPTRNPGQFKIG